MHDADALGLPRTLGAAVVHALRGRARSDETVLRMRSEQLTALLAGGHRWASSWPGDRRYRGLFGCVRQMTRGQGYHKDKMQEYEAAALCCRALRCAAAVTATGLCGADAGSAREGQAAIWSLRTDA